MQAFLQTLHEQYRTEHYGPWHTREYYPWEYDAEAQHCLERGNKPSYFVTEEDCKFFQQQAKILQDRAAYIRQEWARQEATLQPSTKHITQPSTKPVTQPVTQSTTQLATQQATQPEHSVEQEEELQQANAENTAEKPSDNKATISKNTAQLSTIPRHMLSTVPRQITTQQAENDTTIWPAISACLGNITLWYITAMSTQEKDLLRRSQPIGPLQARVTYRTMHIWTN
ncbi:hypothetical protein HO133_009905 [Letharia lupina]|uniref:Uncharacterized protein n=1 Tax=Letharia lupina TaxID=560253 RepID=A0A8H6CLV8_9LECA|nr:uncharacterized protein HO133_009905 [Letharia lupina]KAF6225902.1 hypothetical protein HO133_009905 [Letharia lupina]